MKKINQNLVERLTERKTFQNQRDQSNARLSKFKMEEASNIDAIDHNSYNFDSKYQSSNPLQGLNNQGTSFKSSK